MSTSVMHMPIPSYKPANRLCIFNTRASKLRCISGLRNSSFQCNATTSIQMPTTRRSGNYRPSLWDFNYIQSLNSGYTEERYLTRASELIKQVQMLLEEEMEPVRMLELIDDLQRLGISYHFEEKFDQMLNGIYKNFETEERDLYSTSLGFRLLRQHGFRVSQEVFDCFKNEKGDFEPALGENTKGLLQLYEASFLLTEGEKTLELAKEFAISLLRKKLDEEQGIDEGVSLLIRRALELPIHWRTQRPNARWFIDAYERKPDMNPIVLELAKLDFNIVQTTHQAELKHVSRWWNSTRLAEKLPFARDRLVESHFWTIGIDEPRQYGYQRIKLAETVALINVIDDIFDIYGTFEELQLFTEAVQRWDIESINQLPEYMQICYLALYNFVNEMAYDVLVEKGFNIIAYLRKSWTDLIQAYLQEAKWYYNGYKPNLEEYLNNGWISITNTVILPQVYFQLINSIEKEAVESLYEYHDILRVSGIIFRLADDLGTSTDEMERGDVPKAVQCYMNERNVSEQEAREYVKFLMEETWKKLNKEVSDSPFPKDFTACPVNVVRIAQFMYQYGDGHGMQHPEIHDQITKLLFEPFSIK